jgi:hypothetical protein
MTISIPIISEFQGQKAFAKAKQEFKQLEGIGKKAQFAIKKAAIPAALAIGALAAAGKKALEAGEAVNSANKRIENISETMGLFGKDAGKVSQRLVTLAEKTALLTGVSNIQIKEQQAQLLTFKNLAKTAGDTGGMFDRASAAVLDMQAANVGGGNAAIALGKALENPIKGITALAKSGVTFTDQEKEKIKSLVESNKMLEAQDLVLQAIEKQVGGTAEATADDTDKMKEGFAQFQQSLGMGLLPILEAVTPLLLGLANWAKENPGTFKIIAAALFAISVSIMAINAAMALNPIGAIVIGVIALIAGVVLAYKKFETFRNIVKGVFNGIKIGFEILKSYFQTVLGFYKTIFNGFASIWNSTIGKVKIKIPDIKGLPGRGKSFGVPKIPMLAEGGIIANGAQLAVIGEAGPEAVIPLNRMGEFGMGSGGINITVQTGVGDPVAIGREVQKVLTSYERRSGGR